MKKQLMAALMASSGLMAAAGMSPAFAAAPVPIDNDDIGGVVTSSKGPEAGVWVVAETKDVGTQYIKIAITDDQGRYVIPDLPKAKYKVWVRGYGLSDSKAVDSETGKQINITATLAPSPQAAAQIYPAQYWYALIEPPKASEFPGTGPSGNGISPGMGTQQNWLHHMQENCMFCHQLGTKATRELPDVGNPIEAWDQRLQKARAAGDVTIHNEGAALATTMNNNMTRFGRQRGLKVYADWTDKIAKGAVPEAPPRPAGIERNVVVTVRDYAEGRFTHDMVASDRRNPNVNAGGPMYGLGMLKGYMEILDSKTNKNTAVPIPGIDPPVPHDETARIHHNEMDEKGRVWMAGVYKQGKMPDFCTSESNKYAKYFPAPGKLGTPLPVYDPADKKVHMLHLCGGGNHASFGFDKDSTVYLSSETKTVSWVKSKVWAETRSVEKSHGWCPMVIDTNADGKIEPDRTKWNEDITKPMDPKKDTQFTGFLYGINVGKDDVVYAANYVPYVPSRIVRFEQGANAPETCKTEVYEPPMKDGKYLAYGVRGIEVDADGVAWAAFSSGHVGKFDRSKCKVTNGPTATGQQCPEGWTIYRLPGPTFVGTDVTPNFVYGGNTDFANAMGLGENTLFFPGTNSDSIITFDRKTEKFMEFRVPYPIGFYTRDMHFRVDDPKTGWKGRAIHATYSLPTHWHMEEGEGAFSKIASFQIRPDPLAH
ncbi:MAG: carboxypeptidase-like regulatory domain-containing protein [Rhodospirillaceae bacterium]|nr:carboxypeptidase-like regulatory domain-containing protein [Rhodospirillaceae bacterium]